MKKNSEAFAPQLFSLGNIIIAYFRRKTSNLRAKKQNCYCI